MRILLASIAVVLLLCVGASSDHAGAVLAGDVNCNGSVDAVDALGILQATAGQNPNADCLDSGDVDCDGDADAVDALSVLRHIAGLEVTSSPGCPAIGTETGALLLNEVLYVPGSGESPFVELKNEGGSTASLDGLRLVNERNQSVQFGGSDEIGAGGVFLRSLAGADFLDGKSGFVELRNGDGDVLDRVAWGDEFVDAVNLGAGAVGRPLPEGASIGRPPGANTPKNRLEWAVFYDGATPGAANPDVDKMVLLPANGARFMAGSVPLNWYPVPGAMEYRLRVFESNDPGTAVVDETVAAPGLSTGALAPGEYYWNVQAIGSDAGSGPVSADHTFAVVDSLVSAPAGVQEKLLDVDLIAAHKDTSMLLLESFIPFGEHAWDVSHPGLDMDDPADRFNAFPAAVAMINGYFGGGMSQDRIAFEARKDRYEGPQGDLSSGFVPTLPDAYGMLSFVFGGVSQICASNSDLLWDFVTEAIDEDAPLIGFTGGNPLPDLPAGPGPYIASEGIPPEHLVVVTGYGTAPGLGGADPVKVVAVNDALLAAPYAVAFGQGDFTCFWKPAPVAIGAFDEPEVSSDRDGDGVVDFDETMRFHTDPDHPDTDRDGLNDKQDIRESVFGMGVSISGPPGRDWDGDGVPMELDCDSDNDGSLDGVDSDNFSEPSQGGGGTCDVIAWVGETHSIRPGGANEMIEAFGRDLVFVLAPPEEGKPLEWHLVSGTVEHRVSGTTSKGCPVEGTLLTDASENEGYIFYLTGSDTYTGLGNPSSELNYRVNVVEHCPDGEVNSTRIPGTWFLISNVFTTDNPSLLEGENILETGSYDWSFHAGSPISRAAGRSDRGNE